MFYTEDNFSFFASQFGAYLNFLQFKGRHFLHQGDVRDGKVRCSHLCVPWFGPLATSSKPIQHGYLRKTLCEEIYVQKNGLSMSFDCLSGVSTHSPPLRGMISYLTEGKNRFFVHIDTFLVYAGSVLNPAPINPAQHFYWANPNGINIQTAGYAKFIKNTAIPKPIMFPYIEPVTLTIVGTGTVTMRLRDDELKDPQIVVWSDSKDYTCVELVAGHPDSYQKENGLWTRSITEPFTTSFIFDFSLEE